MTNRCQRKDCRSLSQWLVLGEGRLEDGGLCGKCVKRLIRGPITLRSGLEVVASFFAPRENVPFATVRAVPPEPKKWSLAELHEAQVEWDGGGSEAHQAVMDFLEHLERSEASS